MAKITGKNGRVTVDSTVIGVTQFQLNINNERQDCTNSESGGWREGVAGLDGWDGNLQAQYDSAQNPHDDPPDIKPGNILAATFIVDNAATNVANGTYSGNIFIDNCQISLVVEGKVNYTVNFTGNGILTYPTGTLD